MTSERIYWVDRCLGAIIVPDALRGAGIAIQTYADVYPDNPRVPDEIWIPEISGRGWVIVTKDKNIRRKPVEVQAIRTANALYVCLSAGSMRGTSRPRASSITGRRSTAWSRTSARH